MTTPSLEETARAYHAWRSDRPDEHFWAVNYVLDLCMTQRWEDVWSFILVLCATVSPDRRSDELGVVGAGPLEDLLYAAGPQFIERIEQEVESNKNLAVALTGVWRTQIDQAVWERVVRICRSVPDPIDGTYTY